MVSGIGGILMGWAVTDLMVSHLIPWYLDYGLLFIGALLIGYSLGSRRW